MNVSRPRILDDEHGVYLGSSRVHRALPADDPRDRITACGTEWRGEVYWVPDRVYLWWARESAATPPCANCWPGWTHDPDPTARLVATMRDRAGTRAAR